MADQLMIVTNFILYYCTANVTKVLVTMVSANILAAI